MYGVKIKCFAMQLLYVIVLIPFLYFTSFKVFSQVALFRTCTSRIEDRFQTRNESQYLHVQRDENVDEELLDRIVNPDM